MNAKNNSNDQSFSGSHSFSLKDRKFMKMNGVKEVVSFNEEKVILQTNQGILDIKGKELNIKKLNLDDSNIEIEGYISSLEYLSKITKKGLINRLFK